MVLQDWARPLPHLRRDWARPLPHLRRDFGPPLPRPSQAREAFVRCFELRPTKGDMLSNLGNIAAMRVRARASLGTSHDFA